MAEPKPKQLHPAEVAKLEAEAEAARKLAELRTLEIADHRREQAMIEAAPLEARIFTFDDRVSATSVQRCIHEIGMWVRRDPSEPIEVVFNSPGGSVFDGLALFDYIRACRDGGTRIDTSAIGMAASMGGVLLQAGQVRTMSAHSYLMIHEVSTGAVGKMSELEDEVKFANRLQDRLLDILSERAVMSRAAIRRKWKKTDWWLDAPEALELGFVDRIV